MKFLTENKKKTQKKHNKAEYRDSLPLRLKSKRLNILVACFLFIWFFLLLIFLCAYIFEKKYAGCVYPGVRFGNVNLGGFNKQEVKDLIKNVNNNLQATGITFIYKGKHVPVFSEVVSIKNSDLAYDLFYIDTDQAIKSVFAVGRSGDFLDNLKTKLVLLKSTYQVFVPHTILADEFKELLAENFKDLEVPSRNAKLKITRSLDVVITPEEHGIMPDYELAVQELEKRIANLNFQDPITLVSKKDVAEVSAKQFLNKKLEIQKIFSAKENLSLGFQGQKWTISKKIYKDFLDIQAEQLFFNTALGTYIKENIAKEVEVPVQEARFGLRDGNKIVEFRPSVAGVQILYDATLGKINQSFFGDLTKNSRIEIMTQIIQPKHTTESVNELGIKELLGVGKSNFAGSPSNRRHNIKTGADALNGLLISPNENFSLVNALGVVNKESGYLAELVIKGNKTIPEFGGGLCQVGTTLFRGALQSGLQITERRNHSYRVSYYEPAGTDCTIYAPKPDCKFLNDTDHYILLQTYVLGDELIFEFWGTGDGREVVVGKPVIDKITEPPPTKYIETEDLEEGEIECTERAHNGASAEFDYSVKYADGTEKLRTFYSYYKPWQAVCLVGKKEGLSVLNQESENEQSSQNNLDN